MTSRSNALARVGSLLLIAFLPLAAAHAQSSEALAHYRRGLSLYEDGDWGAALKEFEQAHAVDPKGHRGERIGMHFEDYDPAFQIGRIQARLGNFREAQKFFAQCAAGGYTEKSNNAEEFRRWRAIVERAMAAAPTPVPSPPGRLAPTPVPLTPSPSPPSGPTLPASAATGRLLPPSPTASRLAALLPPARLTALPTAVPAAPSPSPSAVPLRARRPRAVATPEAGGLDPGLLAALLAFLAALGLLVFLRRQRARRPTPLDERAVSLGRYGITGLLGTGRHSFIYEARDRRAKHPVALRIRRPDLPADRTAAFSGEVDALEKLAAHRGELPVPRLLARGVHRGGAGSLEYAVLEPLSGRSLFDVSRQARRRLDPTLSIEILAEIVSALRSLRAVGAGSAELSAQDVFLLDPVPSAAGNPIRLKIIGVTMLAPDPAREPTSIAALASELFRGRTAQWEEDEWIVSHVPVAVRQAFVRAREGSGISLEEIERTLRESTRRAAKW